MARIRHIAVSYKPEECEAIADFYKNVFGMVEQSRRVDDNDPNIVFICLTDGYLDLSLVPSSVGYPEGIDHLGFQVDDVQGTYDNAMNEGAKPGADMVSGRNSADWIRDPGGVRLDLDSEGWNAETIGRVHAKRSES